MRAMNTIALRKTFQSFVELLE